MEFRYWICLAVTLTAAEARGQAVQLPTFRYFAVSTTVSVPDSGAGRAAGVNRSATGRTRLGMPGAGRLPFAGRPVQNSAIGAGMQAGGLQVRATIHDLDAMDRALQNSVNNAGVDNGRMLTLVDTQSPVQSIADIRRQQAGEQADRNDEAAKFIALGQRAQEAGKAKVAMVYYRNAAARGDDAVKREALGLLQSLEDGQNTVRVAVNAAP